jgi:serine phosphatase RsbU (regulator of sigma subunit)/Tfp pilus assembly protein PilF
VQADKIDSLKKVAINQQDTLLLKTLLDIGNRYYNRGQLDSSFKYYQIGYEKSVNTSHQKLLCEFLLHLGLIEREKGVYNRASEYYFSALKIAESNNFKKQKASIYNGIAIINNIQKEFNKSIDYYIKSLEIYKELNYSAGQSSIYNNIGLVHLDLKEFTTALKYFFKALEINKKIDDDFGMAVNSENIGLIYHELKNYNLASIYYDKALKIWYLRNDENSVAINLGYIGNNLLQQKKYKSAIDTLKKALHLAQNINSLASMRDLAFYLSDAHTGIKEFEQSLMYYKMGKQFADSLINNEKTREITEIQLNYTFNKIKVQDSLRHQIEVESKEMQLTTEKNYKYIAISIILIISVLLFFVFKNYREKLKANAIITEQKNLVEQKQKEILDSITYAKRIQTALLSQHELIAQHSKDCFIYFKPKDIVSGDFYWAVKKAELFYLAVCDSTGHGVPGAFMSLLGIGYLNEAVNEKNILKPNLIFDYVRERIIESIGKEGQQDGFDGILLCINTKLKTIEYAAANNSPVAITNKEIIFGHSDKMPVGNGIKSNPFSLFTLPYNAQSTYYLYTDGYADQFGGPKGKKFMYKQLNQLLINHSELTLSDQEKLLELNFESWKGNLEQVDDVAIIGVKVKA